MKNTILSGETDEILPEEKLKQSLTDPKYFQIGVQMEGCNYITMAYEEEQKSNEPYMYGDERYEDVWGKHVFHDLVTGAFVFEKIIPTGNSHLPQAYETLEQAMAAFNGEKVPLSEQQQKIIDTIKIVGGYGAEQIYIQAEKMVAIGDFAEEDANEHYISLMEGGAFMVDNHIIQYMGKSDGKLLFDIDSYVSFTLDAEVKTMPGTLVPNDTLDGQVRLSESQLATEVRADMKKIFDETRKQLAITLPLIEGATVKIGPYNKYVLEKDGNELVLAEGVIATPAEVPVIWNEIVLDDGRLFMKAEYGRWSSGNGRWLPELMKDLDLRYAGRLKDNLEPYYGIDLPYLYAVSDDPYAGVGASYGYASSTREFKKELIKKLEAKLNEWTCPSCGATYESDGMADGRGCQSITCSH